MNPVLLVGNQKGLNGQQRKPDHHHGAMKMMNIGDTLKRRELADVGRVEACQCQQHQGNNENTCGPGVSMMMRVGSEGVGHGLAAGATGTMRELWITPDSSSRPFARVGPLSGERG